MSSILQTIDSLKQLKVGDYVQFYNDRVGYIDQIIDSTLVRIREASENSVRCRFFNVRSNLVTVIPISGSGSSPVENRNLVQPPSPRDNKDVERIENIGQQTKELIDILKKSRSWCNTNKDVKHPFFEYLENNKNLRKGWIRERLPDYMNKVEGYLEAKQKTFL